MQYRDDLWPERQKNAFGEKLQVQSVACRELRRARTGSISAECAIEAA